MANHLYGYSTSTAYGGTVGGASANTYSSSRSLADSYTPYSFDPSRYTADPYAAAAYSGSTTTATWPGPPGVDSASAAASSAASDPLVAAGLKRSSADALYYQSIYSAHNPIGQSEASYATNPPVKRPRFESASNLPIFPQRPGEKDCAYYMLTRTCKFGETCKFDHPVWVPEGGIPDWKEVPLSTTTEVLPERPGEPDCPYFVRTQRCKFGVRCRFNHPKEHLPNLGVTGDATDVTALPERPSEQPCAFYMKTGTCKYGPTCKFHHPKDIQIPAPGSDDTNGLGDENPTNLHFSPATMHNSKGLPVRLGEVDCPFYLKTGSCKYGATCRYNHPDRNMIVPPAAAITSAYVAAAAPVMNIGVVNPAASILQTFNPTLGMATSIYPQRPGQMECDFYMKTGECKFADKCRFHHPIDRTVSLVAATEAEQQHVKLSLAGLPRREGAIHCPYYMKTGMCKYSVTCKFDHPPPGEVMALAATTQGVEDTTQPETQTETETEVPPQS